MRISKGCNKCGKVKQITEFYAQPGAKDGRSNACKECTKKQAREHRKRNADYYRQYDRSRANLPHRVEMRKRYAQSKDGKEAAKRANRRYIQRNSTKRAAHVLTGNAIRDGKLEKKPCEVCGSAQVHAHHDDYMKPLEVRWLCPAHHKQWHDENGEGKNAD